MNSPPITWRRGIGEALKTEFSFRHEVGIVDLDGSAQHRAGFTSTMACIGLWCMSQAVG